jgi:FkbM family methyltransferase
VFSVKSEQIGNEIRAQLERLLAEPPDAAAERLTRFAERHRAEPLRYVLYGAGQLGRKVLNKLRAAGVEPLAFADDTPEKVGQTIDGLAVGSPQDVIRQFGAEVTFIVTILNPRLNFLKARERILRITTVRTLSLLDISWIYPDQFLPDGPFEAPQTVLTKATHIKRGFNLMTDRESQMQFVAHLKFRLFRDYQELPRCVPDDYFPPNVVPALPENAVFVDCGAYDGDTLRAFLRQQSNRFGRIYAFEPDPVNYAKLRDYVSNLGTAAERIHIYNCGVGSRRRRLKFIAEGNMGSSFSSDGCTEVDVVPLAEVVPVTDAAIYLKFDVEGGEWDALKGGMPLIEQGRPLMAISAYHRPDDLWQLPIYIESLGLNYRTFLRTQGEDGMDVIAYFVP